MVCVSLCPDVFEMNELDGKAEIVPKWRTDPDNKQQGSRSEGDPPDDYEDCIEAAANSYFFSIMTIIGSVLPAALGAMVTAAGYQATTLSIVPIVTVIFGATMFFARRASAALIRPPMAAGGT